jgi:biopolymer transport protein ExbB
LERAVTLALRVESDRLRRNVGSLRRIAALAPLIGLLGTLFAIGRVLESIPPGAASPQTVVDSVPSSSVGVAWGPALAGSLTHLSTGIIIATLALVAYDGLLSRIEKLAAALDRVGSETIDAIALAAPVGPPPLPLGPAPRPAHAAHRSEHDDDRRLVRAPHLPQFRGDEGADLSRRCDHEEAGF